VDVSPSSGGTVKVDQTVASSYPAVYPFRNGTNVRLEAVPASGYLFNDWSGDLSHTTNPTTIVIDCDKRIIANFSQMMTLTMAVSGTGSTNPAPGTYDYREGTVVSIEATTDTGWQFDSWTGDVSDTSSAVTTVTMDSDKTITANFSVSWPLVGGVIGGVVLIVLLVVVLITRRSAH